MSGAKVHMSDKRENLSQTATGKRLEVCGLRINPCAIVDLKLVFGVSVSPTYADV